MRYPVMLVAALVTPASAAAHTGPHAGMGPLEILVHMAGQHFAPVLAVAFIAALLLIGGFRRRRKSRAARVTGIDRQKRQR